MSEFDASIMDDATFRDIEGVDPGWTDPNQPNPPIPRDGPIVTRIEGPWGVPYVDGLEDPFEPTGLLAPSKDPQMDQPDIGWQMGPGDYEGAFRTRGPVRAWGHEISGGIWGDQALGRTMRFPVNIPDRYDVNGVWVGDYRDQLAYNLAVNNLPQFTEANAVEDLVTWEPPKFAGYEA
jgi:hypothetical protein